MELPRLQPLYATYRDRGFTVVAVERTRDTGRAKQFIAEHSLSFPCLENGTGEGEVVWKQYQVAVFPTSMLIDRRGRVVAMHVGFEEGDEAKLEAEVRQWLER
ncbi:MAG: TlpA family protein disulfide reductase [Thermoanaerobaculaceae bacterium]|nr:TlpA family protein disulfide reductase [Thermoanaerobaculaceae bacterium]